MGFQQEPVKNFIGNGLTFPIKLAKGTAVLETGFELIRSSIRIILSWSYPRRFFLAEFNSRLFDLLEEPNDAVLEQLIETFVIEAINQWEKRVELISATFTSITSTEAHLQITYRIVNTQQVDNFIYPFYRNIIY